MTDSKTTTLFKLLFWFISILHILSIIAGSEIISILTKPFLMIFLAGYFWSVARISTPIKSSLLVYGALLFSFFGDIFLMHIIKQEIWFICGVFSFMIAQIFYVFTYKVYQSNNNHTNVKYPKVIFSVVIIGYTMILWAKLYPHLQDMLIPVTIYTLTILVMVLMAISRQNKTSFKSFILVFSGAVIFLASDSMIAINKFANPIDYERILIMSTYILGQFLIISGLIEHIKYKYRG